MQKFIHRQPKSAAISKFSRLPIAILAIALSSILVACDDRPTASMKVVVMFDDCTSEQTIALRTDDGEPVTTPELLSKVNSETEVNLGCGLEELEYAFNTNPAIAKIEFDLDEASEVTAFVPLDGRTKAPQPFVTNTPNFRSVSVEISFPTPNTAPLRGSVPPNPS